MSILALPLHFDVSQAVAQLDAHPELWDQHRDRLDRYGSPHTGVSDIWVRFNDWKYHDQGVAFFQGPHESVWYDCIVHLPAIWSLVRRVKRFMGASQLGGVLITRIPPGGEVKPHIDTGWHANHYRKVAVQLKGNAQQAFCFEGCELRPEAGDAYEFDNGVLHWVTNDSQEERITLICCLL